MNAREKAIDEVLTVLRKNFNPNDYHHSAGYEMAMEDVRQLRREGGAA